MKQEWGDIVSEKLSKQAICRALRSDMRVEVDVLESVDSTNLEAKRRISAGLAAPLLLLARTQTAGRGRLGRSFCSPEGAGLYMSLVLHPDALAEEVLALTSAAAVAVATAIEALTDLRPKIKWVNDVYLGDKKVSGILTEGVTDPESGRLASVVVGIGINCTHAAFPDEVAAIATSLADEGAEVDQSRLAAEVCDRLLALYEALPRKTWLPLYRERSWLCGREVVWRRGDYLHTGRVLGIGEEGELILATDEGEVRLSTGEVSVRPVERAQELF
jgi:BirA family biotin operon repressor/biotin-[acetyl-CoA-carboxylase] ligase